MPEDKTTSNFELVRNSTFATQRAVFGGPAPPERVIAEQAPPLGTSYDRTVTEATQAIAQTTAIVIQDGADMLRNVSTIEVTTIGAATAAFFATKNPMYLEMIQQSLTTIGNAADTYVKIGQAAYTVLSQFKS
jgi:hypothetical protein